MSQEEKPKKSYLSSTHLQLKAAPPKGAKFPANLKVDIWNGQPNLTANTNVESDFKGGYARAGLDVFTFHAMIETLRRLARGDITRGFEWENDQGKGKEKHLDSRVQIDVETAQGKYEGAIYIAVLKENITPVKFYVLPSLHHRVKDRGSDNQPAPLAQVSRLYAMAVANAWEKLFDNTAVMEHGASGNSGGGNSNWKPKSNDGGGGGNSNWKNNNSGGWKNRNDNGNGGGFDDGGSGGGSDDGWDTGDF